MITKYKCQYCDGAGEIMFCDRCFGYGQIHKVVRKWRENGIDMERREFEPCPDCAESTEVKRNGGDGFSD